MKQLHRCMMKKVRSDVKEALIFCGIMGVGGICAVILGALLLYGMKWFSTTIPVIVITELWYGFMAVVGIVFVLYMVGVYLENVRLWCEKYGR